MKKRYFLAIIVVAMVSVAAYAYASFSKSTPQAMQARPLTEVGVVTLSSQKVELDLELSGRIKPSLLADVRPQVAGIINEVLFNEGEFVKAGQVMYRIEPDSYKAAYDQANAALKSAEANLQAAKLKSDRYSDLIKHNGVSRQEYDDALAAYRQSSATVDERKASLETARINLARCDVTAPISGYAGISSVTRGALVTANQADPLVIVRALDKVYVDMTQSASQILKVRMMPENANIVKGTLSVKLKLDGEKLYEHEGKMRLQEIAIDESTGTVTLRAEFPNPDRLLMPGMFVKAIVHEATAKEALLLSPQSVTFNAKGEAFVFKVNSEGVVEKVQIKVAPASNGAYPVIEGLAAGDKIVIEGISKIRAGDQVKAVAVQEA